MGIRDIGDTKRRYGYPRIYVRLRQEGWWVNHMQVERIYYRDEGHSYSVWRGETPRPTARRVAATDSARALLGDGFCPWPARDGLAVLVFDDDRFVLERGAGD